MQKVAARLVLGKAPGPLIAQPGLSPPHELPHGTGRQRFEPTTSPPLPTWTKRGPASSRSGIRTGGLSSSRAIGFCPPSLIVSAGLFLRHVSGAQVSEMQVRPRCDSSEVCVLIYFGVHITQVVGLCGRVVSSSGNCSPVGSDLQTVRQDLEQTSPLCWNHDVLSKSR